METVRRHVASIVNARAKQLVWNRSASHESVNGASGRRAEPRGRTTPRSLFDTPAEQAVADMISERHADFAHGASIASLRILKSANAPPRSSGSLAENGRHSSAKALIILFEPPTRVRLQDAAPRIVERQRRQNGGLELPIAEVIGRGEPVLSRSARTATTPHGRPSRVHSSAAHRASARLRRRSSLRRCSARNLPSRTGTDGRDASSAGASIRRRRDSRSDGRYSPPSRALSPCADSERP